MIYPQHSSTPNFKSLLLLAQKIGGTVIGQQLGQKWGRRLTLAVAGMATVAAPAHALRINATYSSDMSLETTEIINDVIGVWENTFYDSVELNINFSFADSLPTGVLGGSKPGMIKVKYKDYLTALGQDALSNQDFLAIGSQISDAEDLTQLNKYMNGEIERKKFKVKNTKTFDLLIDEAFADDTLKLNESSGNGRGRLDDDDDDNNQKIWLTRSTAKALGIIKGDEQGLDANIVLSSVVNWDMDSSDGVDSDKYDFRTVVLHEIGHALGFVSGADAMEFLSMSSTGTITDDQLSYVTPMNTVMYSEDSAAAGVIDMRLGQGVEKYMSIDGGLTAVTNAQGQIAAFSTGGTVVGGDGFQSSHWKNTPDNPLGIMNPSLEKGQSIAISDLDLSLLDVTGWDRNDRTMNLMNETGLDWEKYQQDLEAHIQSVVATYGAIWESYSYNQDDSIREELEAKLRDLYKDVEADIHKHLYDLKGKLANEDDPIKRQEERDYYLDKIWGEIEDQDDKLKHFADDMKDVNIKVRDWLDQDVDKLADLLRNANQVQIHQLAKRLKRADDEERVLWEDKLSQALGMFLVNPDKALAQISQTNNFHNNIGGGGGVWWGGWWASSAETADDLDLYSYSLESGSTVNTAQENHTNTTETAQSVPEPSSVIGLIVIGGLGALSRKRK